MHRRCCVQTLWLSIGVISSFGAGARAADVGGMVSAGDGQPVAGARVTLFDESLTTFLETRSTAQGTFVLSNVNPGVYQLGVAARGFDYDEQLVQVLDRSVVVDVALSPETHPGAWAIVGNTLPEFFDATDIGILLADGTIFYCHDTVEPIRFNPVTGEKTFPAGTGVAQGCMNATLLADGRFIMMGGQDGSDPGDFTDAIPWVKTYDNDNDSWTWLADMQHEAGRWYPGLARLADGSLLVMGGGTAPSAVRTETCERFDLQSETWSYTGSMINPTEFPPSALLHTGDVLMTWSPPQLYDPQSEIWSATGDFNQAARGWPNHSDHSIVVLEDGDVLAIGVRAADVPSNTVMAERYDPATEEWSLLSSPELVRFQTEVVPLPDGRIFVGAGETQDPNPPVDDVLGIVKWCDVYDPDGNTWRRMADMNWFREYHAVTMLVPDGRVLTTGGTRIKFQFGPTSADIEAFSPPYLFRGVRPQITDMSTTVAPRGATLELSIFPQTQITSVVLIGTPVTTHWVDAGIPRRLVLPLEQKERVVTVTLPSDPNVLPLGHYMLFAMVDDIPSVARIVQVTAAQAGDLNSDGAVDEEDRAVLCSALGTALGDPGYHAAADLDANGVIDELDQQMFNELLPPCVGDVVSSATFAPPADGVTDGADLAYTLGAWGAQPSCADFVSSKTFALPPDGVVDGADLAFLLGAWGACE